jgi:enterochelin esterase-like enzyme
MYLKTFNLIFFGLFISVLSFSQSTFTDYDEFIIELNQLTSSSDQSTQLNTFWDDLLATGNFPFSIENKVAFLYRGSADKINWAGMFNGWSMSEDVGVRLGVSDIWILEKEFPADTRCEYKIIKNGSTWLTDPNNPHPIVNGNSELWMQAYSKHTELIERPEIPKGDLSNNILKFSSNLAYSCQYRVYTPAAYNSLSNLETVYVTDGQNYLDETLGKMVTVLDNLIEDAIINPLIVVFLDPRDPGNLSNDRRGMEYRNNINFVNYITQELIPDIDGSYKTNTSSDARAILGASYGGYNAEFFSIEASDYFHNIGMNSPYLHPNGDYNIDAELQAANLDDLKLYLSYGVFDSDGERYFSRLANIFTQKEKEYNSTIIGDGHTWQNWSRVIADALEYFFPKIETTSLTLTYPNGDEYLTPGSLVSIQWNSNSSSNLKIEYSINNGADWNEIAASVSASANTYDWPVPDELSEQCRIRITAIDNLTVSDESDNTFEIGDNLEEHLLQKVVDNSLNYYRTLKQNDQIPSYELVLLSEAEWTSHSANVQWDFEAGYVNNFKVYVTDPHTTEQSDVFPTIESIVRYTVAKEMLLTYCATNAPDWFQYGYAAYEAQLDRPYETIRTIYAANSEFPDLSNFDVFDPENNKQQRDLAFTMGEYCMLILGDYPKFPSFSGAGISVLTGDQTAANGFWHLFLEKHYLESTDQVKILVKNTKIAIYGASKDASNAQLYLDTLSSQLQFYEDSFQVEATHRLNILINPDKCTQLLVEGYECTNPDGGGGHGSGLAGCAFVSPSFNEYRDFIWLMTHEFTHVYQFWIKSNFMPAWLSEGIASCLPYIKVEDSFVYLKDDMFSKWTIVRENLERDPTISELMDYNFVRSNNIDYYGMGWLMVDYIIKKEGYLALRSIIESNGLNFSSMGFDNKEDFMEYFYHYFNIRIMEENIVSLSSPSLGVDYSESTIDINWVSLNQILVLDLEISTNEGAEWVKLLSNSTLTSSSWDVPSNFSGDFYLKFSALENLNISNTFGPFSINDPASNQLTVTYPNGGEIFLTEYTVPLTWESTSIPNIKIEYSNNNGSSWNEIISSVESNTESYEWEIPNDVSSLCKVRISDVNNSSMFDVSNSVFTISDELSNLGGPYLEDEHTVLLLHFNNSLVNSSGKSGNGTAVGGGISYETAVKPGLEQCLKLDNDIGIAGSYLTVQHTDALSLAGDWTIELWMKPTAYNNILQYFVQKPGDSEIYFSNYSMQLNPYWENVFFFFYFSGEDRIGMTYEKPELNQWYHIVFIRDAEKNEIRTMIHDQNRVELSSDYISDTGNPLTNVQDLLIGQDFIGCIDELRISNIVRKFEVVEISTSKDNENLYSFYPNPASSRVYFSSPEIAKLSIFNISGQKVVEKLNYSGGYIDISGFEKGIYIVAFTSKSGTTSKKLIIE